MIEEKELVDSMCCCGHFQSEHTFNGIDFVCEEKTYDKGTVEVCDCRNFEKVS